MNPPSDPLLLFPPLFLKHIRRWKWLYLDISIVLLIFSSLNQFISQVSHVGLKLWINYVFMFTKFWTNHIMNTHSKTKAGHGWPFLPGSPLFFCFLGILRKKRNLSFDSRSSPVFWDLKSFWSDPGKPG